MSEIEPHIRYHNFDDYKDDINKRIGEWLGWEKSEVLSNLVDRNNFVVFDDFDKSLDACAVMEAEILKRELDYKYICNLETAALYPNQKRLSHQWMLTTATPEQRCRAWSLTVEEK